MVRSTPSTKSLNFPGSNASFMWKRVLHVHVLFLMSVWHMAAGSGFAVGAFCRSHAAVAPHTGRERGRETPSDRSCPLQGVLESDIWHLSSLSVDRPPVEPSQYISVPQKHPDKMGFDEVRNLLCCLLSCLLTHHLILNVPSNINHAMILV